MNLLETIGERLFVDADLFQLRKLFLQALFQVNDSRVIVFDLSLIG
jgi:hypothetical protein